MNCIVKWNSFSLFLGVFLQQEFFIVVNCITFALYLKQPPNITSP